MSRFLKFVAWTLLAMLVVSVLVGGLVTHELHDGLNGAEHWRLVIDDEAMDLHGFSELGLAGGMLAALLVGLVCVVLVPLLVILAVGVPLLAVLFTLGALGLALLSVAGVLALPVLLPLLFIVWVMRRAARGRPA